MVITKIEVFKDGKVDFTVDKPCSVRILPLQPIWLVWEYEEENNMPYSTVLAICSSRDKADRYVETLAKTKTGARYCVECWDIDKDINGQSLD